MPAAPIAVAALLRLMAWVLMPVGRFASDEQGYVDAGIHLATTGRQDLFWPPMTGWIVAAVKVVVPTVSLHSLRLLWVSFDLVNLILIGVLATRIARTFPPDPARRFVMAAMLAYALYLPAISHAQFVTSEMPALLLVLTSLVLITAPSRSLASTVGAGVSLGLLVLVRANLVPLAALIPAAALSDLPRPVWFRRTALVLAIAAAIPAAVVARNRITYGEATLSRNAAYNLYIGNRDFYAEDLDLIHPRATPEQIEFRRRMFAGTLEYPPGTAPELQREALGWMASHPGTFLRRAVGRLARVFAPKTDVLELAGGEAATGIFSMRSLTLLGLANLQWVLILAAGVPGLALLFARNQRIGLLVLATIAGSVALCLIAIAKPRYSFVFDPLLILAAAFFVTSPQPERMATLRRSRFVLAVIFAFLIWGWVAWAIFAMSSRL